jgi:hypothetical protein
MCVKERPGLITVTDSLRVTTEINSVESGIRMVRGRSKGVCWRSPNVRTSGAIGLFNRLQCNDNYVNLQW